MYNTKLQGRSRIRRTHNYTWHKRQKQLNPIVTVGNKITKAVRSDKVEFRTGNTRPQPVPMSDIRGKAFSKVKTVQNCDKTAFRRELLKFFGVDIGLDSREIHPQKVCSACRRVVYHLNSGNLDPETSEGRKQEIKLFV